MSADFPLADVHGDGVPDRLDQSPFTAGNVTYTEAAPLSLKLSNLSAGKTTFVDFQLRPKNDKQLWFAFNVLDWPLDNAGQLQDVDNKTFADSFAPTPANPSAPATEDTLTMLPRACCSAGTQARTI